MIDSIKTVIDANPTIAMEYLTYAIVIGCPVLYGVAHAILRRVL